MPSKIPNSYGKDDDKRFSCAKNPIETAFNIYVSYAEFERIEVASCQADTVLFSVSGYVTLWGTLPVQSKSILESIP